MFNFTVKINVYFVHVRKRSGMSFKEEARDIDPSERFLRRFADFEGTIVMTCIYFQTSATSELYVGLLLAF